ncbi:MAG TPA: DUF1844 domain-containing protein [Thermoanaerobaculia bacterium]|nr:DUF1844 domain-containing protein [Thermoanaerobaculia bacterium]
MSKEDKEIKITDKRMFTADGELRQEYRFLDEKSTAPAATPAAATAVDAATGAPAAAVPPARPAGPAAPATPPTARDAAGGRAEPSAGPSSGHAAGKAGALGRGEPYPEERSGRPAGSERPERSEATGGGAGESGVRLEIPGSPPGLGASFYDLAAMLAEPVAIYLGDLELPDGQSAENLEMARLHIDLLDILRQKTAGNLTAQESAFLEDLLYRLRVRYVQKRG